MINRASIALACSQHAERNTLTGWLTQSGYDTVPIADITRLDSDLQVHPVEALIADAILVPREDDLRSLLRRLGGNRPLLLLGEAPRLPRPLLADVSVVPRPLTRDEVML